MAEDFDSAIPPFTGSHPPSPSSRPPLSTVQLPTILSIPISCLKQPAYLERYDYIRNIERSIQMLQPDFRIRVEDLATLLIVSITDLREKGVLSPVSCIPHELQERLVDISPFCKHYMLHLDPENIDPTITKKFEKWHHAIPGKPKVMPRLNPNMDPYEVTMSMYYNSCFKTGDGTLCLPDDSYKEEENKCKVRDRNKCIITGRPNPSVFWFIPRGWNNTKEHNNATGNLEVGCYYLTGVDLLEDIQSSTQLGKTQKAWNMLCIDPVIYKLLVQGLCAFFYSGIKRNLLGGKCQMQLKFVWMPFLRGRFNQVMDLNKLNECGLKPDDHGFETFSCDKVGQELSVDIDSVWRRNFPPEPHCQKKVAEMGIPPIASGRIVWIEVPDQESKLLESAVKIHWSCVIFTALCGGTGQAWFLTGMNHKDGSLQPRDKEFREDKEKEG
ncbi:hypothetical protein FSST1_005056 [Fusarium sambucinum]